MQYGIGCQLTTFACAATLDTSDGKTEASKAGNRSCHRARRSDGLAGIASRRKQLREAQVINVRGAGSWSTSSP
jgi:hypothetical protein